MGSSLRGLAPASAGRGASCDPLREPWINGRRLAAAVAALSAGVAYVPPAGAARQAIAVYRDWGAFAEQTPRRCFAIAAPPPGTVADPAPAYAAVTSWPDRGVRAQVSALLSHGHRAGAPVTLTIGDSAFSVVADAKTAWARDRRQDASIVAAMRSGSSMSISTVSPRGHPYADVYRLRGAASAIDAAMLACPPVRR